jgi:hypothetical protein
MINRPDKFTGPYNRPPAKNNEKPLADVYMYGSSGIELFLGTLTEVTRNTGIEIGAVQVVNEIDDTENHLIMMYTKEGAELGVFEYNKLKGKYEVR